MLSAVQLAIVAGAIAAVVNAPSVYNFTSNLVTNVTGIPIADYGRPRISGLVLHGAVVALLVYLVLQRTAPTPVYLPPATL